MNTGPMGHGVSDVIVEVPIVKPRSLTVGVDLLKYCEAGMKHISCGRRFIEQDDKLNDIVFRLEHALLKRLVARRNAGTDFSYFLSFISSSQADAIFRYCRVLEHGSLVGFAQQCLNRIQTEVIMDYQCTLDTVAHLQLKPTRARRDDVSVCTKLWTNLSDDITCRPKKDGFICVFAIGSTPTFLILGVEEKSIVSQWQVLKTTPRRFNLSTRMMKEWKATEQLSMKGQLDFLNCFPPQHISSRRTQWLSWSTESPKQKVLNGMRGQRLLEYITMCNHLQPNKTMHEDHLVDEVPVLRSGRHRTYTRSQTPGIQSLKSQFINKGFLRIIDTSVSGITLVWNSYDQYSGVMDQNNFVLTHITRVQAEEEYCRATCERCHHYLTESLLQNQDCAHIILLEPHHDLLLGDSVENEDSTEAYSDSFVFWLKSQMSNMTRIYALTSRISQCTFACMPAKAECLAEGASLVALCTVKNGREGQAYRISCNSASCVKGNRSLLSNFVQENCCCHLRCLLESTEFETFQNSCIISHSLSDSHTNPPNHHRDDTNSESSADSDRDDNDERELEVEDICGASWCNGRWNCSNDCSMEIIPFSDTIETRKWRTKRCLGTDICRSSDDSIVCNDGGLLVGLPCLPSDSCDVCGSDLSPQPLIRRYKIVIHTEIGSVVREQYSKQCSCTHKNEWNPCKECVHTVNDSKHGVGYEVIYEYLGNIVGSEGKFSGVPMHIGHMAGLYRARTSSKVSNYVFRRLIQSGVCMWLRSLGPLKPCCSIPLVGGDGTFIGVPLRNVSDDVKPVWEPETLRKPMVQWNRNDRAGVTPVGSCNRGGIFAEYMTWCKCVLNGNPSKEERVLAISKVRANRNCVNEQCFIDELLRWAVINRNDDEYFPLRMILTCLISNDSIFGVFPVPLASYLICHIALLAADTSAENSIREMATSPVFLSCGVAPEVLKVLRFQLHRYARIQSSTLNMMKHYAQVIVTYAETLRSHSNSNSSLVDLNSASQTNPATTGIRYFMTTHTRPIRNSWPLPESAITTFTSSETSCEGCTKQRFTYIGHRQRTGIWITVCMIHECIVGYHLIKNSEGRRDAIVPLYRYMELPPKACWFDFGCGVDESSANWLPEFFAETQFFHDCFHGYSHVCSERFFSRRLPLFSSMNTSIMEQVNSFLQPLRGIVKAPTTKLSTLMFWMEVFATVWNHRKLQRRQTKIQLGTHNILGEKRHIEDLE